MTAARSAAHGASSSHEPGLLSFSYPSGANMTFRTLVGALGMMAIVSARAGAGGRAAADGGGLHGRRRRIHGRDGDGGVGSGRSRSAVARRIQCHAGAGPDRRPTPFFTTWPLNLGAGGSFTGVLFTVTAILGTTGRHDRPEPPRSSRAAAACRSKTRRTASASRSFPNPPACSCSARAARRRLLRRRRSGSPPAIRFRSGPA